MSQQMQLFLLPFAGGNSSSFKNLLPFLDQRIDVVTVEYAGRSTRHKEKFIDDYDAFLNDVVSYIAARRKVKLPYAVLGYSLGSAIAYDLLSRNLIEGKAIHAFLCAKGSLQQTTYNENYQNMPDKEFINEIIALGGIDKRIVQNQRFLDIYMEPVRADYIIWNQYTYLPGHIGCNATAIYSKKDPVAIGVHDWSKLVEGHIDYYEMGTNHFFINQYWETVANIMNQHLLRYMV